MLYYRRTPDAAGAASVMNSRFHADAIVLTARRKQVQTSTPVQRHAKHSRISCSIASKRYAHLLAVLRRWPGAGLS